MTNCPACGKELKENAIRCIHCGNYLNRQVKEKKTEETKSVHYAGNIFNILMKIITTILMVIGGIAVLALGLVFFLSIVTNLGFLPPQTSQETLNSPYPDSRFLTYENQSLGYKIKYPSSWSYQIVTESDNPRITFANPERSADIIVYCMDLPRDTITTSVDEWTTKIIDIIRDPSKNPNSQLISNTQSRLSGYYAREIEFSDISDDGKKINSVMRITQNSDKLYVLLFITFEENFKSYSSIAQIMFDSFTIEKASQADLAAQTTQCLVNYDENGAIAKWNLLWNPAYIWEDGSKTYYQDGALYILDNPTTGATFHTLNKNFDNFVVGVDSTLESGTDNNWQGIEVRQQDKFNYYSFDISSDGYYEVLKFVSGQSTQLVKPTYSSYIGKGSGNHNHFDVKCDGDNFSFFVNGHLLETITDNTYSRGTISLRALAPASQSLPTEIKFENFEICHLN